LKGIVFPKMFRKIPSEGMAFSMVLLLGTILTAHIVVLSAYAQGPPPGAPASQSDPRLAALTDRWWKWILSLDTTLEPNPFTTTYGGDCSQLIQGNTMFLVGQAGGGGGEQPVHHGTCIVPSGTSILFPLVNSVNVDCTSSQNQSRPEGLCTSDMQTPAFGQPFADFREEPNEFINQVTNLEATIEVAGVVMPLEAVRVQSPPGGFGVRLSPHNALFGELPFDTVSLHAVVDGYWVLLPPLSPGEYTLTFGACSQAGCQTNIYTLIVQ
jgi:hypothetical protein